jgi:ubiquinone/menaquinone biosynthesis C-methylase UbiE
MNNKERFTNRVETYVKHRPSYPKEAIDYLFGNVGVTASSPIADVGAGTGIFSELLLERGCHVIAVEPNAAMREASVQKLGVYPGFIAWNGSAEATGLESESVDYITCAQAFH